MDLQRHPLPEAIVSIADLRIFVEHHVYAVWDFMLLLKSLQQHLAPSGAPWSPPAYPFIAGLINSMVCEEECDCLPASLGGPLHLSHFGIYRRAMQEIGADTTTIDAVMQQAMAGDLRGAVQHHSIPPSAAQFLATTQELIQAAEVHSLAAAFAYGRELLVPDLFRALLTRLRLLELHCPTLCWYLDRHIALDAETHGPMAENMVLTLAADDPIAIRRVEQVRRQVVGDRICFWNAICSVLIEADDQPCPSPANSTSADRMTRV